MSQFNENSVLFRKIFGAEYNSFINPQMIFLYRIIVLDVVKLDIYFRNKYNSYTDEMSMKEFVQNTFGEEGYHFISSEINKISICMNKQ